MVDGSDIAMQILGQGGRGERVYAIGNADKCHVIGEENKENVK